MNSQSTSEPTISRFVPAGYAWGRLNAEREDVCAALLSDPNNRFDLITNLADPGPAEESTRAVKWKHRELLQARLRQIDDALDRVISGSYGHCSACGKPIEDRRLVADPAVSTCVKCQRLNDPVEPELTPHTL